MGKGYLIDTNAVIDYLDGRLPKNGADLMDANIWHISVITRIELLAWPKATKEQLGILSNLFLLHNYLVLKSLL